MSDPIINPPIPFNCRIPGGIQDGEKIIIHGKCNRHQNDSGFSINLAMTQEMKQLGDMALHFNPRFPVRDVIRNHQLYGSWGTEEKGGGFPFQQGIPFEVSILTKHQHYEISINGEHFCNFHHRMSKENVKYLVLTGTMTVSLIEFRGGA